MNGFTKTIVNGLKTYVQNNIKKARSNWNQNDETAVDYVKNRTHWTETKFVDVIPETTLYSSSGRTRGAAGPSLTMFYVTSEHISEIPNFTVGEEYTVIWNGTEYKCKAKMVSEVACLGNESIAGGIKNTGEPFFIMPDTFDFYREESSDDVLCMIGTTESITEVTIKVSGLVTTVHKIDAKYLPEIKNIKNLVDGESIGSIRTIGTNTGIGEYAFAEGYGTTASGDDSHAEGRTTTASGDGSHAEGYGTTASYFYSHAEGNETKASGNGSHAEGFETTASGHYGSHAEGENTTASGRASHAEGQGTTASNTASHAEGRSAKASGVYSHAEGRGTIASGDDSHAEGRYSVTLGHSSHAEGRNTTALGLYSHAEGIGNKDESSISLTGNANVTTYTVASWNHNIKIDRYLVYNNNMYAKIISYDKTALTITLDRTLSAVALNNALVYFVFGIAGGTNSHTEGYYTEAPGESSHAEGRYTTASGINSHTEGNGTTASGESSHAKGYQTTASGNASHAEGYNTIASGSSSHAEGRTTTASGEYSHAEGYYTTASGEYSHTEGKGFVKYSINLTGNANVITYSAASAASAAWIDKIKVGRYINYNDVYAKITAISTNDKTITLDKTLSSEALSETRVFIISGFASGMYSHVEGNETFTSGIASHAEGEYSDAKGDYSHAEGSITTASGYASHAEGQNTKAIGDYSHAEGDGTKASEYASHSEGRTTIASGKYAHAEGVSTIASGYGSHAEGLWSNASGEYSHAEGISAKAIGDYSHAEGDGTKASSNY
jgi:hypothetical protein